MKVVVDTNVIVAGLLSPNGPPAAILNLIVNGKLQPLFDNRILKQYIEVLGRDKFSFEEEWIDALVDYIREEGEYVSAEPTPETFAEQDDRAFYEVAVSGGAQYLITGNRGHFPKDSKVVSPREFLAAYVKSTSTE